MPDLSLQIKASAESAVRSLDRLETKLGQLNGALTNLQGVSQFNTLAEGISHLSVSMAQLKASQSSKDFSTLANNLNKIANVNYNSLNNVAQGLQSFVPAVASLGNSNISGSVTRLVNALTKLSSANLSGLQNANFGRVGAELAQLTNTLANTDEVSIRTTKLVEALSRLASVGGGMTSVTNAMPGLTTQLVHFFSAMANVSTVSEGTIQLTTALAQLASAGKRASVTAGSLRTLGTELNNLIGVLAQSPQVANSTVELVKALSQISNQGVRINAATSGLRSNFGSLIPMMNKTRKSTQSLASAFGMFYAKFFLLLRGVRGVWSAVESAMDFVEVYNYFDASISQVTQKATGDWQEAGYESAEAYYDALYEGFSSQAKELTKKMSGYAVNEAGNLTRLGTANLGLDPKTMLNYQAQFAQLSSSMGIASDYAMKMSQALTEIGADLASVKNMEFQEVWDNMSSGIVGMSRAVDKYGVNIRNTALQQKLYDLGIDASITKLGQQDKALLRAITILDSTRYAWADLADTLEQPANQLRMLKANIDSLARTLGGALLGAVAAILPYINALTIALQRLIQYIIDFFGIQLVTISSQSSAGIGDLMDSIEDTEDALGSASGAAKKLKQNLLGIDELNIINTDTSGGGGGGVGDYSDELKNAFDAIYDEYQKVWDKAYENVENKAKELSDKIVDAFKKGDYFAIGDTIATSIGDALKNIPWDKIYQFAKNWGSNLANFINGLFNPETFSELGKTIASAINTALYFQGNFLDDLDPERIGLSLAGFVNKFVDTLDEKQLAHNISEGIKKALKIVSTFLQETDFEDIGQKIGDFLKELDWLGILNGIWEVILSAMTALLETFNGIFEANPLAGIIISGIAVAITTNAITPIITALSTALTGATGIGALLSGTLATNSTITAGATALGTSLGGYVALGLIGALGVGLLAYDNYKEVHDRFVHLGNEGAIALSEAFKQKLEYEHKVINAQLTQAGKESAQAYFNGLSSGASREELASLQSAVDWTGLKPPIGGRWDFVDDEFVSSTDLATNKIELLGEITGASSQQFFTANGRLSTFAETLQNIDSIAETFAQTIGTDKDVILQNLDYAGLAYVDLGEESINASNDVKESSDSIFKSLDSVSNGYNNMSGAFSGGLNQMKTFSAEQSKTLDIFKKYDDTLKTSGESQNKYRENLWRTSEAFTTIDMSTRLTKGNIDLLSQSTILSSQSMIESLKGVSTFFTGTFSQVFGVDNVTSMLSTLPKAFGTVFKNTANVVVGIFNQMIKSINEAMNVSWDDVDFGGDKVVQKGKAQLLKIGMIPQFSLGGFPEDGLFFANSNEMVGSFTNGKTAVANNDQIVAGIEQGVYNAVMSAMSQGSQNVNVTLEGDAEGIFRVVRQQNRIYKNSTGTSAFA